MTINCSCAIHIFLKSSAYAGLLLMWLGQVAWRGGGSLEAMGSLRRLLSLLSWLLPGLSAGQPQACAAAADTRSLVYIHVSGVRRESAPTFPVWIFLALHSGYITAAAIADQAHQAVSC